MNLKTNSLRIKRGGRPFQLLKSLAIGTGIISIVTLSPFAGAQLIKLGIRTYIRKKRFEKEKFLRDLKNLQRRELINYRELDNGIIEIKLTKMGKELMLVYKIDEIRLNKPSRWDRKWRLIIFDIPDSYKLARDAFREKLRELKFYPLQKSIYITPYPCENEIDFISSIYNVRQYVLILYVNYFEGEGKLKHYFKLD